MIESDEDIKKSTPQNIFQTDREIHTKKTQKKITYKVFT